MRFSTVAGWAFVALALGAWRPPSETPPVDRNSNAIRAVLAQPITSDPASLLVAQEKLRMAKDVKAAEAITLYLAANAVRRLFGESTAPKGTVGDIVEGRIAIPPMKDLVRRVLVGALHVQLGAEPVRHTPNTGRIELPVNIRNATTQRVTGYEFKLVIGPEGARTFHMKCDDPPTAIEPNQGIARICTTNSQVIPFGQLESAVKQPGWLGLEVTRLAFDDAKLLADREKVLWFGGLGAESWQKAREELDAMDCSERASCLREAIPTLDTNPGAVFGGVFAGVGLVAGTIIALFTRRRWRWGWSLVGLLAGALVALFVGLMMANSMGGLAVMLYGPIAFGGFLVGLLIPLAVIKGRRPE